MSKTYSQVFEETAVDRNHQDFMHTVQTASHVAVLDDTKDALHDTVDAALLSPMQHVARQEAAHENHSFAVCTSLVSDVGHQHCLGLDVASATNMI